MKMLAILIDSLSVLTFLPPRSPSLLTRRIETHSLVEAGNRIVKLRAPLRADRGSGAFIWAAYKAINFCVAKWPGITGSQGLEALRDPLVSGTRAVSMLSVSCSEDTLLSRRRQKIE